MPDARARAADGRRDRRRRRARRARAGLVLLLAARRAARWRCAGRRARRWRRRARRRPRWPRRRSRRPNRWASTRTGWSATSCASAAPAGTTCSSASRTAAATRVQDRIEIRQLLDQGRTRDAGDPVLHQEVRRPGGAGGADRPRLQPAGLAVALQPGGGGRGAGLGYGAYRLARRPTARGALAAGRRCSDGELSDKLDDELRNLD